MSAPPEPDWLWVALADAFGNRGGGRAVYPWRRRDEERRLRELRPMLGPRARRRLDARPDLGGLRVGLMDLHAARASEAKQRLVAMAACDVWVVNHGKGKGVLRAVTKEVLASMDGWETTGEIGSTRERPTPGLTLAARSAAITAAAQTPAPDERVPRSAQRATRWLRWGLALAALWLLYDMTC